MNRQTMTGARVKMIASNVSIDLLEAKINAAVEELSVLNEIIDIRYTPAPQLYTAMIIYRQVRDEMDLLPDLV